MTPAGMVIRQSPHDARITADRLREFVDARRLKIFAHIDHDTAAAEAGLELPFTQILIFGNPTAGTPLMRASPSLAIDLPLRVLIWEDQSGAVWLGYDDPIWVADRHGMLPTAVAPFKAMQELLARAAAAATAPAVESR